MITLVTGKIGGGKTLFALAHQMLPALLEGRCVVSNIALKTTKVRHYFNGSRWQRRLKLFVFGKKKYKAKSWRLRPRQIRHIDFQKNIEFQNSIPFGIPGYPVLVVVDEAHLYYNSANQNEMKKNLLSLISFLTQSRKACVDILFITQHKSLLWNQFREQVEFGYRCRDMRHAELPIVGAVTALGLRWAKYDVISDEILGYGSTKINKALFALYDTYQTYDEQMDALMASAERWQPITKKQKS